MPEKRTDSSGSYVLERLEIPVSERLAGELMAFWERIFQEDFSWLADVLAGGQIAENLDWLYLARKDGRVVSSCRLTCSHADPRLAALGEVATEPAHRGQGLAGKVCRWAGEDLDQRGGQALFLGTGNPDAARVYARHGWRFLAGSGVMLRTTPEVLPEEFLVDYFRAGRVLPVEVRAGGPQDRVPMIPLLLTAHDWIVLDANAAMFSIRYYHQGSCEGLYLRYQAVEKDGAWFVAARTDGAVVGLASAKRGAEGGCCVEAFTHPRYTSPWLEQLYDRALEWAEAQEPTAIYTTCAPNDVLKPASLSALGFRPSPQSQALPMPGRADRETLLVQRWERE